MQQKANHHTITLYPLLIAFLYVFLLLSSLSTSPLFARQKGNQHAIDLGTANSHVQFEKDSFLGLETFTIETWFKIQGSGSPASTGNGGIIAIPLVAKGRDEAEGEHRDLNYFLGILDSNRVLAADFEDRSSGANHPVIGSTLIPNEIWNHAAITFDGSHFRLYLNGNLEAERMVSESPRNDSTQHFSLATAQDSKERSEGHFDGILDEVRIWNYARSQPDIQDFMSWEVKRAQGLVARWGFNEGEGITTYDSSGNEIHGTILGVSWSWIGGAPLQTNHCPDEPLLISPPDGSVEVSTSPSLDVQVSDVEDDPLTVCFYGRKVPPTTEDFTIVVLPDTQYYSKSYPETFTAQTQWTVDSKEELNTLFVTHLGDIVDDGDYFKYQWENANESMSVLDDMVPYGILPGNHDMDMEGVAKYYDQYFPACRYENEAWYGEGYRDNKNSFQLFSVGSLDFIILHLEYNPTDDVLAWADNVLGVYPDRSGIVSTHDYLNNQGERSTNKGRPDGNSGEEIWQKLIKSNCNVFMVLGAHHHWPNGESRLTSTNDCGDSVHQILQNYQHRPYGGSGFLRYYTFAAQENKIYAYTYSVTQDVYETDDNSQFVLDYYMGADEFENIDTLNNVPSGSTASTTWENLDYLTGYEWYVTLDDQYCITTGPYWTFTTEQDCSNPPDEDLTCNGIDDDCDGSVDEDFISGPTECGQGECAGNTGDLSCQDGVEIDTCDPYNGATEEICDNLDNDCDGRVDEGFTDTDLDGSKDCVDPDDDNDHVLDDGDNCPVQFNPTQSDFDMDQEGDFCDLNDDLIYVYFNEPNLLEWQEETGYDSWNVYKNDLDVLKSYGIYTGDPQTNPLAQRHCDLTETHLEDTSSPAVGNTAYYLVTGVSGGVECSLGNDSEGNERLNDNPCP